MFGRMDLAGLLGVRVGTMTIIPVFMLVRAGMGEFLLPVIGVTVAIWTIFVRQWICEKVICFLRGKNRLCENVCQKLQLTITRMNLELCCSKKNGM